jgi:hypothetical protein
MKDVFCLATFAIKVLCLVVFVIILKPRGISTVEAPSKPQYCELAHTHPLRQPESC